MIKKKNMNRAMLSQSMDKPFFQKRSQKRNMSPRTLRDDQNLLEFVNAEIPSKQSRHHSQLRGHTRNSKMNKSATNYGNFPKHQLKQS